MMQVGLLHPMRREGNGSIDAPVSRRGHMCAYEDCPEMVAQTRITESGFHVLYCRVHEALAARLFGD